MEIWYHADNAQATREIILQSINDETVTNIEKKASAHGSMQEYQETLTHVDAQP